MSFNFLLPVLTFVNIAPQLTSSQLVHWWPLAVNIIIRYHLHAEALLEIGAWFPWSLWQISCALFITEIRRCSRLVALLTGWASSRVPGTKPEHRKIVIAASAFGNTNSALLMLVTAMCSQEQLPFYRALGSTCVTNVRLDTYYGTYYPQQ
jgi:predicted permease